MNQIQLSKRLAQIAELTHGAKRLADVGCDHGYLPIRLIQSGKIEHAIALDVNRGPLARAQEHICRAGLEAQIETRLSDGVAALAAGEADTVVIAGMGGILMEKIMTEGAQVLESVQTLVLQPQSEIGQFRRFLHGAGYRITEEAIVRDEGKFYPMMRAQKGAQEPWSEAEYAYGKLLLQRREPALMEFLDREYHTYDKIWKELKKQEGGRAVERRDQIRAQLGLIEEAMAYNRRQEDNRL